MRKLSDRPTAGLLQLLLKQYPPPRDLRAKKSIFWLTHNLLYHVQLLCGKGRQHCARADLAHAYVELGSIRPGKVSQAFPAKKSCGRAGFYLYFGGVTGCTTPTS